MVLGWAQSSRLGHPKKDRGHLELWFVSEHEQEGEKAFKFGGSFLPLVYLAQTQ